MSLDDYCQKTVIFGGFLISFRNTFSLLPHQLTYSGQQNPPMAGSYPPYSAPSTAGYGTTAPPGYGATAPSAGYGAAMPPAGYGTASRPPPIGFNPSVVQGAAPCKILLLKY